MNKLSGIIIELKFVLYTEKISNICKKCLVSFYHCAHVCVFTFCVLRTEEESWMKKWRLAGKIAFPQFHGIYTERLSGLNQVRRLGCLDSEEMAVRISPYRINFQLTIR